MRPTDARPRLTREQIDTTDLNQAEETRLRYAAIVESSHVKHSASRHAHVSINGEVDNIAIHSQVGRGTTIHAVVPLVTQGSDRPRP